MKRFYEKGKYELLDFEAEIEKNTIEFEMEAETGKSYQTSIKKITLIIHNINEPRRIKLGRKKQNIKYNKLTKILTIPFEWNIKHELELNIKLSKK